MRTAFASRARPSTSSSETTLRGEAAASSPSEAKRPIGQQRRRHMPEGGARCGRPSRRAPDRVRRRPKQPYAARRRPPLLRKRNVRSDNNDDDICLKAGRDADGLRVARPTEYVVVRNNLTRRGGGLLSFGSETSDLTTTTTTYA